MTNEVFRPLPITHRLPFFGTWILEPERSECLSEASEPEARQHRASNARHCEAAVQAEAISDKPLFRHFFEFQIVPITSHESLFTALLIFSLP